MAARAPTREYFAQEQEDGEQVIQWLARQRWSNGNVGMFGISWGGFNSIQMAMRQPPALKAILALDATEALFKEDVHYMDGIMHVDEFEVSMDLDQDAAAAPHFPWMRTTLSKRMDSTPWSLDYFRHQRDGVFWRSPIRSFEDIRIPCFLIGGLQDGYRDSIPRMLEHVHAPVRAWIGPWNHDLPNASVYGPRVEWRDQAVRWFDHWLKGIQTGVEQEPRLVLFQEHSHPPGAAPQDILRRGEWRAESWPPQGLKPTTWYLAPNHQLGTAVAGSAIDRLRYTPSAGTEAGFWWGELLSDQRAVDAFSLTYDSAPLESEVSMLGFAHVRLRALRRRAACRLGGAPRRCIRRRQRDCHHRRRTCRRSARFDGTPHSAHAWKRICAEFRPALGCLGLGARASDTDCGVELAVADALAHALPDDDRVASWRRGRLRHYLADRAAAGHGTAAIFADRRPSRNRRV